MFRFIHTADIHLDSPLRGLERYEGAPVEAIRESTRRAFANLVALAIEERVDFVLIVGDLYDGDWDDYNTGLYFIREVQKLAEADIRVFLIAGNHDAANRMTRSLRLPKDTVTNFPVNEPATATLDDLGVAIHGQGFATAAVTDDLSLRYPQAAAGMFNIGLLHTCATGLEGHEPYAPCTLDGLRSREYDYWALGHIHKRQNLIEKEPVAVFPGNTQGRHIRETGPKGCLLVTVDDRRWIVDSEFRPLDVLRWAECSVNASEDDTADEVLELLSSELRKELTHADERLLAARVVLAGACRAHAELIARPEHWTSEIRARAISEGGDRLWVEKIKFRTSPPAATNADVDLTDGPIGELLELLTELRGDRERLTGLREHLDELGHKIAGETGRFTDVRPDDPDWLGERLAEGREVLLARLLKRAAR